MSDQQSASSWAGIVNPQGSSCRPACLSRHQYVKLVRDQTVATWLTCHRRTSERFGGVSARINIDNAKCAIIRACLHEPMVRRVYAAYAEGRGFRLSSCSPSEWLGLNGCGARRHASVARARRTPAPH